MYKDPTTVPQMPGTTPTEHVILRTGGRPEIVLEPPDEVLIAALTRSRCNEIASATGRQITERDRAMAEVSCRDVERRMRLARGT